MFSLWGAASRRGATSSMHAAGWLEGGLHRVLREVRHRLRDAAAGDRTTSKPLGDDRRTHWRSTRSPRSARAAISSAPTHTQARYETAFYAPFLSDWRNYEAWERGRLGATAEQRANRIWKADPRRVTSRLPSIRRSREELSEFVERRKREGGAPTDF